MGYIKDVIEEKCKNDISYQKSNMEQNLDSLHSKTQYVKQHINELINLSKKFHPSCIDHYERILEEINSMSEIMKKDIKSYYKKEMLRCVQEME